MRGRVNAIRTFKGFVADLRFYYNACRAPGDCPDFVIAISRLRHKISHAKQKKEIFLGT